MKNGRIRGNAVPILASIIMYLAVSATAQNPTVGAGNPGNNAVWVKNGTTTSINASTAYVDAGAYYSGPSTDICVVLNNILISQANYSDPSGYPRHGGICRCESFP